MVHVFCNKTLQKVRIMRKYISHVNVIASNNSSLIILFIHNKQQANLLATNKTHNGFLVTLDGANFFGWSMMTAGSTCCAGSTHTDSLAVGESASAISTVGAFSAMAASTRGAGVARFMMVMN